jgi:hypothetical protein
LEPDYDWSNVIGVVPIDLGSAGADGTGSEVGCFVVSDWKNDVRPKLIRRR